VPFGPDNSKLPIATRGLHQGERIKSHRNCVLEVDSDK
jgi:hypothetical protein